LLTKGTYLNFSDDVFEKLSRNGIEEKIMENAAAIDLVIIKDNATSLFEENEGEYWTLMGKKMTKEHLSYLN